MYSGAGDTAMVAQRKLVMLKTLMEELELFTMQHSIYSYFKSSFLRYSELEEDLFSQLYEAVSFLNFLQTHNISTSSAPYGFWSVLPDETILHIFSYFEEKDLNTVGLLNKKYNSLAEDDQLWKRLYGTKWNRADKKKLVRELSKTKCRRSSNSSSS
eukprot:TRINITY_DN25713_c0_g1_i1.p1 TRINITY_DN25713_c0_g1~~TRINITY_DN25713_c0_g1_i1.p1  ORF type:complete len:157 (-),score=28.72 TRINITY_DN25713_c0_g1_i1:202-672(-)